MDDATGAPQRVGMSEEVLQRIGPVMQSYVDDRGFAGISVVVARHGRVVFEGQYGQRDKEAGCRCRGTRSFASTR